MVKFSEVPKVDVETGETEVNIRRVCFGVRFKILKIHMLPRSRGHV